MAYFAVSYQLNKNKDYQKLWDEMARLGGHKAMRSFYLLELTNETAASVKNHLAAFVDDDDMIFVARMDAKPSSHQCYKGTHKWIEDRF
ncbi:MULTISPECIES: hypothetical protein [unclassified Erythrobacter]|uniref:hypothetical protein n=1 Tax=unclassified Erythrobacter TaxID=2633097 RepID=UPI0007B81DE7|nr:MULTISPECIES: hypothetical protein [unclassified Erythrobacter]KZY94216.1 hypothetical protein A3745_11655 [Erythrobacter sp. HI0074]KZZ07846.1 hypothetical protein A3748_13335 [Erythrobacter sp. HI0077]